MTWLPAPAVAVRNPIGAGDALLAGLAAALEARRRRCPDAARAGIAAAGAARRGRARRAASTRPRAAALLERGGARDAGAAARPGRRDDVVQGGGASTPDGEELAHGRARRRRGGACRPARRPTRSRCSAPRSRPPRPRSPARRTVRSPGVGVASMGEAGVLLDRDGAPLGPLIAWYDARGERGGRRRWPRDLGADRFAERTGLPVRADVQRGQAPLAPRPRARGVERAVRRLNVAEWIVRGLGGDELTEWSLASRTGWLDLHARDWWDEALAWSGAPALAAPADRPRRARRRARPAARSAARARRRPRDRGPRPPERGGRRRRGRGGRRARLVRDGRDADPRVGAAAAGARPRGGRARDQRRLARRARPPRACSGRSGPAPGSST